jgi:hypothetical protein
LQELTGNATYYAPLSRYSNLFERSFRLLAYHHQEQEEKRIEASESPSSSLGVLTPISNRQAASVATASSAGTAATVAVTVAVVVSVIAGLF